MIESNRPYNAGEIRMIGSRKALICGHIWWPVERKNAYHVMYLDQEGSPSGKPYYVWNTSGEWPLVGG